MHSRIIVTLAVFVGICCASLTPAAGQDKLEVRDADTVKTVLERHVGKRVGVITRSGAEITGTVAKVGEHVVHLSELGGREFFDGVVSLDRLQAVVIRTRAR